MSRWFDAIDVLRVVAADDALKPLRGRAPREKRVSAAIKHALVDDAASDMFRDTRPDIDAAF